MSDWYQIENSFFTVQLTSLGAEIKRLFVKPWHREILWQQKDEKDRKVWSRTAPVLFPIVGKLKNDEYILKGKRFTLPQHGFARDTEFLCLSCSSHEILFSLSASEQTYKEYPFLFELKVEIVLEEKKLHVNYTVKNTDRQDIYFSIGAHPGFLVTRPSDYELQFEKKEKGFYRLNDMKQVDFKQLTAMESNILSLSPQLFEKDALIFKEVKSKYVDLVNKAKHETIRLHGINTPFFGIWSKDNVPFICLEPWFGVSDENTHDQNLETKTGIRTLAAGAEFKFSYTIEIFT